jgi:SSS family transporter
MLLLAIAAYLGAQFAIGIWASRRVRTEDDYLVAGRRLGYPLAIFSLFATWFGAETIMGAAGRTYAEGLSLTSAEPFGYALCLVLLGLVFAAPLWRRGLTTLADLFRQRYSPGVERLAALLLIPASLLWAAAQMRAFGHVLSHASALPVDASLLVAAAFCVAYTAFGGLLADAVTDLVQGVLLALGLLVVLIAVGARLGGPGEMVAAVASSDRLLPPGGGQNLLAALEAWAIPVMGSMIASETVSRVIAARSPAVAQRSAYAAGALYLAVGLIPVILAVASAPLITTPADPEQFLPALAQEVLPTAGYAIFAGAVISAILSTVDSTLLVSSGLLSHNLLVPWLGITDQRVKVRLARLGVVAFGVAAYVLARHAGGVYELVQQASAFGGAPILVAVTFGLFTTRGGPRTAIATLAAGLLAYVAGSAAGFPYPFLGSLGVSLGTYLTGAALE